MHQSQPYIKKKYSIFSFGIDTIETVHFADFKNFKTVLFLSLFSPVQYTRVFWFDAVPLKVFLPYVL